MIDNVFPPPGYVPAPSSVQGIDVFVLPSVSEQPAEVVDFKCPKCGATTAYNVQGSNLVCEHCGYSEAVEAKKLGSDAEQFEFKVETLERSEKGWGVERKEMACQDCGAVVSLPPDTLTYGCPFCGSNKVLYRESLQDILRPRYMIPFKITPQSCGETTLKWLGSSWMTPAALRESARMEKFSPIYIPYWTFNALCHAQWQAQVGRDVTETYYENGERHTRTRTEWEWKSGRVTKPFDDLLVPGTTRLNLGVLGKIDFFNIADLVVYEPGLLAGLQAQAYDIALAQAYDAGRQIMREKSRQACMDDTHSSAVRCFSMTLDFSDETWRYILVPVYTNVYTFGGKTYQIILNGQNGRIAGPRPVDWSKVWLAIAALVSPGILLGLIGLITLIFGIGALIGGVGLFLLVVGLVIAFVIFRQAQELENVSG